MLSENPFKSEQITFRSTIKSDKFLTNLQILNNGNILIKKVPKTGSLIDIDTYIQDEGCIKFSNVSDLLEEGHTEEKKLFFNLLKDEFIQKYNPEY